jgi:hypothetical protein
MKKSSVLWLLPLAAALLVGFPSTLFAGGKKEAKSPVLEVPAVITPELTAPTVPSQTYPPEIDDRIASDLGDTISGAPESGDRENYGSFLPSFVSPAVQATAREGDSAIPEWVLNPLILEKEVPGIKLDEVVVGIGSAKSSTDQLSIQVAEARARQDIAFQLTAQIKARITDYAENEGNVGEFDISQSAVTERIGQQMTEIELKGIRVVKREKAAKPDNTWWVVVTWSKANADKAAADVTRNVIADVKISPAERAQAAIKLMDEQLQSAALKPTVVSE